MSQQTRIDEFYSKTIKYRTSDIVSNAKKNLQINSTPRLKNRKSNSINRNRSRSLKQIQTNVTSDQTSDCIIINELKNIEAYDFDWNDSEIVSIDKKRETKMVPSTSHNDVESSSQKVTPVKRPRSLSSCGNSPKVSKTMPTTPTKNQTPTKEQMYKPKVSTPRSPRKQLFNIIDGDLVVQAIEQLNLAKQGAIVQNNFNLEEIYSNNNFKYEYHYINTKASIKYELKDVVQPDHDFYAKIFFEVIVAVFSNPVNCGYFDEDELDLVYSILTLPVKAQMLLIRMLKRKRAWFRKSVIKYPEVDEDLEKVFRILETRSLCTLNIKGKDVRTMLELLQVDEICNICRTLKVDRKGKKGENIEKLLKFSRSKPLFPGMKSQSSVLNSLVDIALEYCVRLTEKTWIVFDRIMTLLIPNQDPETSVSDTFFMLMDVHRGNIIFPKAPIDQFPIFSCKMHLLSYIAAKNILTETLISIEKKDWEKVRKFGRLAKNTLEELLKIEHLRLEGSTLPLHLRHFMPGYLWLKVLAKSIDAFKKSSETKEAVEILEILINQRCHMQSRKGGWYAELALIEMHHHKNVTTSAEVTMKALEINELTRVDKVDLIERANKIIKRKNGISKDIKVKIQVTIDSCFTRIMPRYTPPTNEIDATLVKGNVMGNKSTWLINDSVEEKSYGSVEDLATYYYLNQGFSNGLHCEGALPVALFSTLFWEELYDMKVPGAFVTKYQHAPQDLFTENFYENRKEQIDMKLQIVRTFDSETLSNLMETKFKTWNQYQSILPQSLFTSSSMLKEIVYCLGVEGIAGICERLIENFKLWRAGFPDLVVWNFYTKKYKIVEVKGPGDTLSTKQRLWLDYLHQCGLNTELCLVRDKNNMNRSRQLTQR